MASNLAPVFLRSFATLWMAVARLSASSGIHSIASLRTSSTVFSFATISRCMVTLRSLRPFFRKGG